MRMRLHRQWMAGVIAVAAAFGAAGCATKQARGTTAPEPEGVYPAVRIDCQVVAACFSGGTGFHERGGLGKILGYTVVPLCWIFDTPVSAVTDTACLPWDWKRKKMVGPSRELLPASQTVRP